MFSKVYLIFLFFLFTFCNSTDSNQIKLVSNDMLQKNYTGFGKYIHENNDEYVGKFLNGKAHGQGKFVSFDGKYSESGTYKNGVLVKGVVKFPNGITQEGNFSKNGLEGIGKTIFPKQTKQLCIPTEEGVYVNGFLVNGVRTYSDGARYEGEFRDSVRHGYGKLYLGDSLIFEGKWESDYFVKD